MPRPYSADLRVRVLRACELGREQRAEIARRFQISEATLYLCSSGTTRRAAPMRGSTRAASPRASTPNCYADIWAFLLDQLGMEYTPVRHDVVP